MTLCEKLLSSNEVTSKFMQTFRAKLEMIKIGALMVSHNIKRDGDEFLTPIIAVYKSGDWELGRLSFKYDPHAEKFSLTSLDGIFEIPENQAKVQKHIQQLLAYLNKDFMKSANKWAA